MALLAFMLAFTFNGAAGRHDTRKSLVIEEANAIDKTFLRTSFLAEPYRAGIRGLLKTYVDIRVKAAAGEMDLGKATHESEALQDKMWALTAEAGQKEPASITTGLFIQSLNEVIDLHLKRVTVAIRNRVPPTIWATLYLLMFAGMLMMGTQIGLSGARNVAMEMALALSFSIVLFLVADLDRPQEGVINVSQQAMIELQAKLNSR
ncbi:MAG: hypothetical protein NTW28_08285 [Candidatus Solibacter sp.]|nr:hypothetical protein [Candidatus Solibacter sp.]